MSGVMLPDCLIAMLPSCIQKIIKDITSNIYLNTVDFYDQICLSLQGFGHM